jgi:hypothetical protein
MMLTTHRLLVPRLRKSWAIPPLTLWVLLGLLRGPPPPVSLNDTEGDADVFTEMRMSAVLAVRKVCSGVFECDQV